MSIELVDYQRHHNDILIQNDLDKPASTKRILKILWLPNASSLRAYGGMLLWQDAFCRRQL